MPQHSGPTTSVGHKLRPLEISQKQPAQLLTKHNRKFAKTLDGKPSKKMTFRDNSITKLNIRITYWDNTSNITPNGHVTNCFNEHSIYTFGNRFLHPQLDWMSLSSSFFSEHVEQLFLDLSLHKSIFLCGDFNIDILKHNSNRGIKYFLDTMYEIGLYPLIDRSTRISNQSFSLIDNIFTNVTNYNITSGILINVFAICTYPNPNRQIKKLYIKNALLMTNIVNKQTMSLIIFLTTLVQT